MESWEHDQCESSLKIMNKGYRIKICNLQFLLCCCLVLVTIYIFIFSLKTSEISPVKVSLSKHNLLPWMNKNASEVKHTSEKLIANSSGFLQFRNSRKFSTPSLLKSLAADKVEENLYYNNNKSLEIKVNSQEVFVFRSESVKTLKETKSWFSETKNKKEKSGDRHSRENERPLQLSKIHKVKTVNKVIQLPSQFVHAKNSSDSEQKIQSLIDKEVRLPNQNKTTESLNILGKANNLSTAVVNTASTVETPIVKNLKDYSTLLYKKSIEILGKYNCSGRAKGSLSNPRDLVLCNLQFLTTVPPVIMITSMYHHNGKQFIFRNTIRNWPLLKPHIQPVLYLSDADIIEKSGDLVHQACTSDWVVAFSPACNSNGYPVLADMITHSLALWPNVKWVGFANGDILFDVNILETLENLGEMQLTPQLLVARRWNVFLNPGLSVLGHDNMTDLKLNSVLHPVTGIDLFVFNAATYPFADIPPFVIGRPAFDNWLIYNSLHKSLSIVDVTETVTCLHQGTSGMSLAENSHTHKKQDLDYNFKYMSTSLLMRGFISCVPSYLYHNKTSTENHTISVGQRKVDRSCVNQHKNVHIQREIQREIPGVGGVFINQSKPNLVGQVAHIVALSILILSCIILIAALLTAWLDVYF